MSEFKFPERYQLVSELGSGGAGSVYKVYDSALAKYFALKVLHLDTASSDKLMRFQKEAKAAGSLKHQNIISVIDFGINSEQVPYMVLEFVDGETLSSILEKEGPLSLDEATEVFEQTLSALRYAHEKGIVHRDLKCSNIMVSRESDSLIVKLFDFGTAQLTASVQDQALTGTHSFIGTPACMSPEQAYGEADQRSDIYSFGCLMFETLTGRLPFEADNAAELIRMHTHDIPPSMTQASAEQFPPGLEAVVAKCLEKQPDKRFQSVSELATAISLSNDNSIELDTRKGAQEKSNRWKVLLAISGIALSALVGAWIMLFPSPPKTQTPVAQPAPVQKVEAPSGGDAVDLSECLIRLDKNNYKLNAASYETLTPQMIESLPDCNVTDLSLECARPTIEVIKAFVRKYPKTTLINLDTSGCTDSSIAEFSNLNELTWVDASNNPISEGGFRELSRIKKLRILTAKQLMYPVSATGLAYLISAQNLLSLNLSDNALDMECCKVIGSLQHLTSFNYMNKSSKGHILSPEELAQICRLKNLTSLTLSHNRLGKEELTAIASLKYLNYLEVNKCESVDEKEVKRLSHIKDFYLNLNECRNLTPEAVKALGQLDLIKLDLRSTEITDEIVDQLSKFKHLTALDLCNTPLSNEGLLKLGRIPTLEKIEIFACTNITPDGEARLQRDNPKIKLSH